ncbi:hypothetical protein MTR67_052046 [Solanum verrucosum]|uniref:Uncharacterized protein n=1 Tax=Solanum verrucosum TaxID=315347 RepID=A0AAF0V8N0_SOLVR|nr:hypothetical protein MTR67_052046 [Solanum verrucosum]
MWWIMLLIGYICVVLLILNMIEKCWFEMFIDWLGWVFN